MAQCVAIMIHAHIAQVDKMNIDKKEAKGFGLGCHEEQPSKFMLYGKYFLILRRLKLKIAWDCF